jgi:hypothetical protein
MRVNEYPILLVNGSMTGNLTSATMPVTQGYIGAVQAVWTGTPTGTLQLAISNDGVIWSVYSGSQVTLSGAAGNFLWNLISCGFNYVQLQYVFGSSSGTLNVSSSYKGV